MKFQTENVVLSVSRIGSNGWWLGNAQENVSKGTALGPDFTENIYTPSDEGMIGKYDASTGEWKEIKNRALDEFWDNTGKGFVIGTPDGDYPEAAITEKPPEYDPKTHFIVYDAEQWLVKEMLNGKLYWAADGIEHVADSNDFVLPDGATWETKPEAETGEAAKLVGGEWAIVPDHRNKLIYDTITQQAKYVNEVGDIEAGFTLLAPLESSEWDGEQWVQTLPLLAKAKRAEIKSWRDSQEADNNRVVTVNNIEWDAGPVAKNRIESTLASSVFIPTFWTDAANIDQTIDRPALQDIHAAIVTAGFAIHARQREMKEQLAALATVEAVNNYLVGWPE